jgi:hypothetical protein
MSIDRDENGRFADGNPGGPGRPRRTVEREYLAVLSEAVSLDDWGAVVARAVEDAKAGDARARDWLSKHMFGEKPMTLTELAAKEERGLTVEAEVAAESERQAQDSAWESQLSPFFRRSL